MTKTQGIDKSEQLFRRIMQRSLDDPDVNEGTGFGATPGLRVGSKIFAMLANGDLVVKLPRDRVDELVASGIGARFDPRRDGRLMKEWATIPVQHSRRWGRLADEALQFVSNR